MPATRSSAWWAARRWWSSKTCSFPGNGYSCAAKLTSAEFWWSVLPPCTARITAAAREACADVIIGAAALAAQYQGTLGASHIKDKLVEMLHLTETVYAGSVACSALGSKTKSGSYYPDPLLANCTKHNITRAIYEISRLAQDIGGGIMATLPADKDLRSPEIGKYVEKYLKGVEGVSTEARMKVLRLLENMTGGTALMESMHGAGSPQSQRIMYQRLGKLGEKMKMAKKIARIAE